MTYKIKLPVFEGPFDLLLYLIRKNEIDIYDIPIAEITHQYLEYIEMMKLLNLEIAGEFIEMVATLMLIKVRMLLPGPAVGEDEDMEDPRMKLVNQLLEYKQFKEAANQLENLEQERRKYFSRPADEIRKEFGQAGEEEEFLIDASLFDLLAAFKKALDNMPKVTIHQVSTLKVSIEEQAEFIIQKLTGQKYVMFSHLVKDLQERIRLIVTFMALLDLMRLGLVSVKQQDSFGEVRLVPLKDLSIEKYHTLRNSIQMTEEE